MQTRHLTLIALLALSACVAPPPPAAPKPAPVAPPVAAAPAAPRLTGDWNDWPFTAGDWTYGRDARGSMGRFGMVGHNPRISLRCDIQAGRLYLSREGNGSAKSMVIRTSSATKEFAANVGAGTPAYFVAEIMPSDPILDAMAFSRGRLLVEVAGQQPIVLPSWAEITRIVEDCRR